MERSRKIRAKITSSLFYPAAVIVVATSILIVLAVFVIPRFKEVFADVTGNKTLPQFTEFVLGGAQFIKSHLIHFFGLAAALVAALKFTHTSKAGRAALDRLKLKLPVLGRIARKAAIARDLPARSAPCWRTECRCSRR